MGPRQNCPGVENLADYRHNFCRSQCLSLEAGVTLIEDTSNNRVESIESKDALHNMPAKRNAAYLGPVAAFECNGFRDMVKDANGSFRNLFGNEFSNRHEVRKKDEDRSARLRDVKRGDRQ